MKLFCPFLSAHLSLDQNTGRVESEEPCNDEEEAIRFGQNNALNQKDHLTPRTFQCSTGLIVFNCSW